MLLDWAFLVAQMVKSLPEMQETRVRSLGQKDSLEEGMATHSSILVWRIPWMEESGWLQSMRSQRVDTTDRLTHTHTHTHTHNTTGVPLPYSCLFLLILVLFCMCTRYYSFVRKTAILRFIKEKKKKNTCLQPFMTNSSRKALCSFSIPGDHIYALGKCKEKPGSVFLYRVEESHLSSLHTVRPFSDTEVWVSAKCLGEIRGRNDLQILYSQLQGTHHLCLAKG